LTTVPEQLHAQVNLISEKDGRVVIETPGELSPLLGWLATLPLTEVRIEPLGLQAVYEQFHPAETAA
jgi:ABC-2 type transport system ATP-binding protein